MNVRTVASPIALAILLIFSHAAVADVTRLSEPVEVTPARARLTEDIAVRVEARISQVCQKKGCFMIASAGDRAVRISFKDYSFFVPTDTSGKTVTLTGTLIQRELSEKQAAHFREDAGTDTIQAGKVYEIVANAVSIPRS